MSEVTVLYVDPNGDRRAATCETLAAADGFDAVGRGSLTAAVETLEDGSVDCVVTAYELSEKTGLDLAARVREIDPDTPCILYTDKPADRIATERRGEVVVEYLPRDMPDAAESLVHLVTNTIDHHSQVGYPLPDHEDERLQVLEQYDQAGMEAVETFDRLTTLAKRHFGVDVAFVGFVDAHEERFLACEGAEWRTLNREDSICTHTILEEEVMVVEDVMADDRFVANDRLDELNIEFYAGATLRTPKGATIGAFCLTHGEPRGFTDEDRTDLRLFADEAMEQLELRHELEKRGDAAEPVTRGTDETGAGDERSGGDDE
jgi:CheY-like chemotaxis protein